jgi:hypothetical protein
MQMFWTASRDAAKSLLNSQFETAFSTSVRGLLQSSTTKLYRNFITCKILDQLSGLATA